MLNFTNLESMDVQYCGLSLNVEMKLKKHSKIFPL